MTTRADTSTDGGAVRGASRDGARARLVASAIDLLNRGGRDAVTTRAVADAAGVQAPTLYRLFGDKRGLLDAVAEHGFTAYLEEKTGGEGKTVRSPDPVEGLRAGWDLHVSFGLARPAIYLLMYADPRPGARSPAADTSYRLLREHVRRVAAAGRLRVAEERAADLFHACACGAVLTLLAEAEGRRDLTLSEGAREAALAAILADAPAPEGSGVAAAAVALRAALPDVHALSGAERALLTEWLDRLAARQS